MKQFLFLPLFSFALFAPVYWIYFILTFPSPSFLYLPLPSRYLTKFQFCVLALGKPSLRQHTRVVSSSFLLPYHSDFPFSAIHQVSNYCS